MQSPQSANERFHTLCLFGIRIKLLGAFGRKWLVEKTLVGASEMKAFPAHHAAQELQSQPKLSVLNHSGWPSLMAIS
ncbi:hypothetical protein PROAA_220013 [Candidatus Propionivibrio aalborgensis]|uniref:Uncharacterized protein n=1 Tax=Candidatus Propionivibrio aalborgensis TaxID=1860101 RepID=A0A1A8XRX6_9RHOO|nr:hypothetical protein PROAA_220013 [Candidatus Propionivibrio aalborgensis]